MHEAYTRTGKITYAGGHTDDELTGIEVEIKGIPVNVALEKDGFKSIVETFEKSGTIKLNIGFEYEADALTALDAIIAAAFEAKRAIESRHQNHARDLKIWASDLKARQKRCRVCGSKENLEAHHLESKHYSPSLMLSLGNGIVLCEGCHNDFHAFCGTKKASRHDFHKWLQERAKGKTFSDNYPKKTEKTPRPYKADEIAKAKDYALRIEKETGKLPGRWVLQKELGCTQHVARMALKELRDNADG